MKRTKPLVRKTPLRANAKTTKEWKQRSAKPLPKRSERRASEESVYSRKRKQFLATHPICPVTGQRATQIHHSARRHGSWLNLSRYWIALSPIGHEWVEKHATQAEGLGLMVKIRTEYTEHIAYLVEHNISLHAPVFYETWDGKTLKPELCRQ